MDRLAARYLGRADLWWVICDYNDIFFPLELEVGAVLRIPSAEHVNMRLSSEAFETREPVTRRLPSGVALLQPSGEFAWLVGNSAMCHLIY